MHKGFTSFYPKLKLSVIIVNYNVKFYLEQCLLSVLKATKDIETEVFVVDNHSRDGSVDYLTARFPNIRIIAGIHNLGFSRANNIAIKQCRGEYVLLLNPDTIVGEGVMREVVDFMDCHPQAGGAGVRMLKTDGTDAMESRRGLPTPLTSLYKMVGLCARFPKSRRFGRYYMGYLPWDQLARIDIISGAFFMVRHSALNAVGLLDEDFFMYGEDVDLSYRLLKGGFENWYVPARILHYKGESTHKSSFRYVHVFYDAMFIFFRKHYGHLSVLFSLPIKVAILLKATVSLFRMQASRVRRSLGFFSRHEFSDVAYVFVGSAAAIGECRDILHRKGIDAEYYETVGATATDGHLSLSLPENKTVNVVYDVHTYSYEQIFELFARDNRSNVRIGTYNPDTKTIITESEVIK